MIMFYIIISALWLVFVILPACGVPLYRSQRAPRAPRESWPQWTARMDRTYGTRGI
jgi:hypothetical protein